MDSVVVPSGYRPQSGCGCFPHQVIETRPVLSDMNTNHMSHPNANSQILHSILSMRTGSGQVRRDSDLSDSTHSGKYAMNERGREAPIAILAVPTPPPSEPGSPCQVPSPGSSTPSSTSSSSPHQQHSSHSHHLVPSTSRSFTTPSLPVPTRAMRKEHPQNKRIGPMPPLIHSSLVYRYQRTHQETENHVQAPSTERFAPSLGEDSSHHLKRKSSSTPEQPIDLSCPKKARFDEIPEDSSMAYSTTENHHQKKMKCLEETDSSILKSILVGNMRLNRSHSYSDSTEESSTPPPLFHAISNCHGLLRSPQERVAELIDKAKARAAQKSRSSNNSPETPSSPSQGCGQQVFSDHDTVVQLAKKNLLPVSARISDWLVKMIAFAKSLPEFMSLPHNDKVTIILSSWSRLLLLYMADTNFHFAVTPLGVARNRPKPPESRVSVTPPPVAEEPTVRATEEIQNFIRKCQTIGVTPEEIFYLRLLTLFNPSYMGTEIPTYIENVNAYVRHSFKEHCTQKATDNGKTSMAGKLRYSQLLLTLPSLYSISPKVMECLFCRNISSNTDMDVLLKEML